MGLEAELLRVLRGEIMIEVYQLVNGIILVLDFLPHHFLTEREALHPNQNFILELVGNLFGHYHISQICKANLVTEAHKSERS